MDELTSSLEEHLAKISRLPESAPDLTEPEGALPMLLSILFDESGQDGLFGKTFPGCYQAIADGDSFHSCEPCPTAGILAPRGGCWTLNSSEWTGWNGQYPNDDGVCSLSDVLETGEHLRRYSLSQKACAGILRRAEKRGKDLPAVLRHALEQVAVESPEPERQWGKTT